MLWHLRQLGSTGLRSLLADAADDALTYGPTGGSLGGAVPHGLTRRSWTCGLTGADAFEQAAAAIRGWEVHRGSGLAVEVDGPLAVGTNVAMEAPMPVGFVTACCRVVAVVDGPDAFGFAYGTLSRHPEAGEEAFVVRRSAGGEVTFEIVAVSRPVHPLARAVPSAANRLQAQATRRYLEAMRRTAG